MTREEFLEALALTTHRYRWYLYTAEGKHMIRADIGDGRECCPITAVKLNRHGEFHSMEHADIVGARLGMDRTLRTDVVWAADDLPSGMREALLEAVGLGHD